ncbi:2-phospho-L-lactate transferase [Aquimixticola soesokkakensis]|uniref:2-phospho-L-lactate transferase n=1 Tax=Aquimixticola soesokkakensis TaxID=1519096 RepID=A0A1Y5RT66_9RHOB|nr:2-phospho-L-lactate transferase [Aquimixticola soesokkakensis]SLN24606.1 2-phospho-L-lactate transferase [Aquimixticola soesokkakensis]
MSRKKIVALSGGVGGAKLSAGLAALLPASDLTIIVNTGDDAEHFGLSVAPDIDTQLYTLSGRADLARGWGQKDETWNAMGMLREMGEEVWFNIGDHDLGLNLLRTMRLKRGDRLTDITADFARALGLGMALLPMSDTPVSTLIRCDARDYEFHEWFVQAQGKPTVRDLVFRGAETAPMSPEVSAALRDPDLAAILIAPSNPYLSIAPILAVQGLRAALIAARAPVIGISPVVGGQAIKGPTAAMLSGFGLPVTAAAVAALHADIFDGYILDQRDHLDQTAFQALDIHAIQADTMMVDHPAKEALARVALDFAAQLSKVSA